MNWDDKTAIQYMFLAVLIVFVDIIGINNLSVFNLCYTFAVQRYVERYNEQNPTEPRKIRAHQFCVFSSAHLEREKSSRWVKRARLLLCILQAPLRQWVPLILHAATGRAGPPVTPNTLLLPTGVQWHAPSLIWLIPPSPRQARTIFRKTDRVG